MAKYTPTNRELTVKDLRELLADLQDDDVLVFIAENLVGEEVVMEITALGNLVDDYGDYYAIPNERLSTYPIYLTTDNDSSIQYLGLKHVDDVDGE